MQWIINLYKFTIIGSIFSLYGYEGGGKKYEIEYLCRFTYEVPMNSIDSMSVIQKHDTAKIPFLGPSTLNFSKSLMKVVAYGNEERSTIINFPNGEWKNSVTRFDSTVFEKGRWSNYHNNKKFQIDLKDMRITYSGQIKKILKYNCEQVLLQSADGAIKIEAWISSELPSALMPVAGYSPLKGAVLEITSLNTKINYIALHVKERENKHD